MISAQKVINGIRSQIATLRNEVRTQEIMAMIHALNLARQLIEDEDKRSPFKINYGPMSIPLVIRSIERALYHIEKGHLYETKHVLRRALKQAKRGTYVS